MLKLICLTRKYHKSLIKKNKEVKNRFDRHARDLNVGDKVVVKNYQPKIL